MTVHHLPHPVKLQCKMVAADKLDQVIAQGLAASAAHIHLAASYLLETGRIAEAQKLTDAAETAHKIYRQIMPPAPLVGNADECLR